MQRMYEFRTSASSRLALPAGRKLTPTSRSTPGPGCRPGDRRPHAAHVDAEQIDRAGSVYATELMRRFTNLTVSPSRTSSMTEYFALSNREGGSVSVGACPMTVYVDQVPMPTPFNLDLLPTPKSIGGIEVYGGSSTIPMQYSGMNRGCDVILVWTKIDY